MNCQQAKKISLVDYLDYLNIRPKRKVTGGYMYLSPLRDERDPSFKVDTKKNVYYDHGGDQLKNGGTIIDFGKAYHRCTISHFLKKLDAFVSAHPLPADIKIEPQLDPKTARESKIVVVSVGAIQSPALIRYLRLRKIDLRLAQQFFCEVSYELYRKQYYAIGFKNDKGGYELRNAKFKGSVSPKAPTFIDRNFNQVDVFEGGMSFLSFLTVHGNWGELQTNFMILNSLSFFEKARVLLEKHQQINLHLDRDKEGIKRMVKALGYSPKYRNATITYCGYGDWNDFLTKRATKKRWLIKKQFRDSIARRKWLRFISAEHFWLKKKRHLQAPVRFITKDENFHPARNFI